MAKKRKRKGRSLNERFGDRKIECDPCGSCGGPLGLRRKQAPIRSVYIGMCRPGDDNRWILVCSMCAMMTIEQRTDCAYELGRIIDRELFETGSVMRFKR